MLFVIGGLLRRAATNETNNEMRHNSIVSLIISLKVEIATAAQCKCGRYFMELRKKRPL